MTTSGVRGGRSGAGNVLTLDLTMEPSDTATTRHAVADVLTPAGVPQELVSDILLVTSELVANAVEHGGGPGALRLALADHRVSLAVRDGGAGRPRLQPSGVLTERGRGLLLVDALTHEWVTVENEHGKEIRAEFRW